MSDVIVGDCVAVMRGMAEASVHAIVTDPPYNLSDSGKRDAECFRSALLKVGFPRYDERDAEMVESGELALPGGGAAALRGVDGAVRVDTGVGVPESAVDLKGTSVIEQEVEDGDVAPVPSSDRDAASVADAESDESLGHYVLKVADDGHSTFCDATCSCFTEPSTGFVAVPVVVPLATCRDLLGRPFGHLLGGGWGGDTDVAPRDDSGSQPSAAPGVVAGPRAVVSAVLCLDVRGRTGELRAAYGAREDTPLFLLAPAQDVGAGPRAGRLSGMTEPHRISVVGGSADRTITLDFPHAVKDRRVGGFMGKSWDGWESPAAFQRWCLAWTREALRVLRPGGYLLAFGGTRTAHRLACAVEDAGFEIRDRILHLSASGEVTAEPHPTELAWVYGSG